MARDGFFTGLDIGTSSIKVLVAEFIDGSMNVIGVSNVKSSGVKDGIIVDIDAAAKTIKTAIEQAEETEETEQEITEDDGFDEDIIGSLIINKINLNGTIKEGSTSEILKDYIGHIEETAKYDGNVGLAAHNRGNQYSYFARINELELGDEIIYQTKYGERKYVVDSKNEILETDWSKLEGTKENRLTLITCIKNKVNQRLCVQAIQENI